MGNTIDILKTNIHDLRLTRLTQIVDDRGAVFHYLKSSQDTYNGFGEAYYSKINPGIIKGWKMHKLVHQHFCVPTGEIKIVIFDNRDESPTKGLFDELVLNDTDNYCLLSMPPRLWYSFKCISNNFSLLANIIDQLHNPDEAVNLSLTDKNIPYAWQ
jgi:dTDP-4-dehydrorhamnose 3,5-epimerase